MEWRTRPFAALFVILILPKFAISQEIPWRHDYPSAIREAREKNLPMILDFGSADCVWCHKLDQTTFHDPAVAKMISANYLPIRIDTNRDPKLTESLNIHSLPTLLFASPDGTILDKQEGYLDAGPLLQHLQSVRGRLGAQQPANLAFVSAPAHGGAPAPSPSPAMPAPQAQQVAIQAPPTPAPAQQAQQPILQVAVNPAPAAAAKDNRGLQADMALMAARLDLEARDVLACEEQCRRLQTQYGELPQASEAGKLLARIAGDPELNRLLEVDLADRLAKLNLERAESLLQHNDTQQAAPLLERVVQTSPESKHANLARFYLTGIRLNPDAATIRAQAPLGN